MQEVATLRPRRLLGEPGTRPTPVPLARTTSPDTPPRPGVATRRPRPRPTLQRQGMATHQMGDTPPHLEEATHLRLAPATHPRLEQATHPRQALATRRRRPATQAACRRTRCTQVQPRTPLRTNRWARSRSI